MRGCGEFRGFADYVEELLLDLELEYREIIRLGRGVGC